MMMLFGVLEPLTTAQANEGMRERRLVNRQSEVGFRVEADWTIECTHKPELECQSN